MFRSNYRSEDRKKLNNKTIDEQQKKNKTFDKVNGHTPQLLLIFFLFYVLIHFNFYIHIKLQLSVMLFLYLLSNMLRHWCVEKNSVTNQHMI